MAGKLVLRGKRQQGRAAWRTTQVAGRRTQNLGRRTQRKRGNRGVRAEGRGGLGALEGLVLRSGHGDL